MIKLIVKTFCCVTLVITFGAIKINYLRLTLIPTTLNRFYELFKRYSYEHTINSKVPLNNFR